MILNMNIMMSNYLKYINFMFSNGDKEIFGKKYFSPLNIFNIKLLIFYLFKLLFLF